MTAVNMTCKQYIDKLFDTYKLIGVLADKNNCKTLRLRHKSLDKDIVLHSLPKPVIAYEILCKIKCENLPWIYDVITLQDGQIVLEEFIDGVTIAEVMEIGKYHYIGARKVLKSVCNALTVLHEHNLVHRDVKPENILVDKNGRVVLIDFNASRQISYKSKDTVIMGTIGYASPEQMGVTQSDIRTDIYAMGVLLNVMITGKHPSEKIARGHIGRIVKKCTSVNPDDRFQSAQKLANSL